MGVVEFGDLRRNPITMTGHAFNMSSKAAMLSFCQRSFRYEGTHPCVVGFVAELVELLFGDLEIGAKQAKLLADTAQPTFNLRVRFRH